MKVSYNWLNELVDIKDDPKTLADTLTMAGLELEKIIKTGIGKADVVAVEILEVDKHPEADRLFVTKVDAGKFGKKQIVTNVSGLQKGQKILAALEGVKLATGLEIKKTKLKGVESEGMFIGWEELGVPQKSEELFYLESSVNNGTNYDDIAPFNDSVIDIELTANRGDCLGMIGVVREVCTLYDKVSKELEIDPKTIDKNANDIFSVEIKTDNCLRYCGGVILDVNIKPSPYWMQLALIKAGIRPINNVVDITNYVLLECNQPLHAFDMDKISDNKIIVRDAQNNEKMTTLDDIERKLDPEDIVIADKNAGHCMGGIMGGQISEVSDSTKNVFLEAAFFRPEVIRKTSKKTGLRSESSYRFERAIDIENVDRSLKRALYLFDKLGVGKVCKGIIDVYPHKNKRTNIETSVEWINRKLGTDIEEKKIIDILTKLGFEVSSKEGKLDLVVPSWRNDVSIREDVAEEIARIYGYNNIKHSHIPSYQAGVRTPEQIFSKQLRDVMYRTGCDEMFNISFYGNSLFDKMMLPQDHYFRNMIMLADPLTDDWAGMRNSLIPGMLKTAAFNVNRQIKGLTLFEIGNVSHKTGKEFPEEIKMLGFLLGGKNKEKNHTSNEIKYDFYDIKGLIDSISSYFKIDINYQPSNEIYIHPFQQAKIFVGNKEIGIIGKVLPQVCDAFDIDVDIFVGEISVDVLYKEYEKDITYKEVAKFPSSMRDLAFVVKKEITAEDIINSVNSSKIDILKDINIFDIFSGGNIKEDSYSIAIGLTFNKLTATLTDEEIENAVKKILANLEKDCGAEIRK